MVAKHEITSWRYCLSAALVMMLYGYDASSFNAVQGYTEFVDHFNHPSDNVIASVNTAYTVCAILAGFFVSPYLSDHYGRKPTIIFGSFWVFVAALMQTFSPKSIAPYIVGRGIIGFAQGVALPPAATYISETAPKKIRGTVLSFYQLFYSVGSFICFWCAFGTTRGPNSLGNWRWKAVTLLQIFCPLAIITAMIFVPESARWLVAHGKIDEARAVMQKIRAPEEVEDELINIEKAIAYEKQTMAKISYKYFFTDPSTRWRFFLAVVINFGQQTTGQGSLNNYSTKIYGKVFHSNSTIQLINALNATFGILFTMNASWTVDRFGRKAILITGAVGQAICMFIVALVGSQTPTGAGGQKSTGVGVGIVVLLFSFIFFYKPSWGATVWIFTSEIFSHQTRAAGVGMASQVQKSCEYLFNVTFAHFYFVSTPLTYSNAILQQAFPTFLDKCGFYTFFFFFGVNVFLALFVLILVPEMRGVSLEDIDTLFGGENHRVEGEKMMEKRDNQKYGEEGVHPPSFTGDEKREEIHLENADRNV